MPAKEGVHLITYKYRYVHVALPVQVYREPEQLLLVLVCKDLLYLNHYVNLPTETKSQQIS